MDDCHTWFQIHYAERQKLVTPDDIMYKSQRKVKINLLWQHIRGFVGLGGRQGRELLGRMETFYTLITVSVPLIHILFKTQENVQLK